MIRWLAWAIVFPCILDAAIFALKDGDAWNEANVIYRSTSRSVADAFDPTASADGIGSRAAARESA